MQDRMRRSMILGGSVGGALGLWFGHHRSRASIPRQATSSEFLEVVSKPKVVSGFSRTGTVLTPSVLPIPRFPNRAVPTRFVLHERDYQTRSAVSMLR
jgi:hypothetical protein